MDLTTLLQLITTASAVVASIALVVLAAELRQTRTLLIQVVENAGRGKSSSHTFDVPRSAAGFAIYIFRNNRWELETDLSAPGFEPSPPTIPGAFEGHVVKKECRPAGEP